MKIGDVVKSKAGGPRMVITDAMSATAWRCTYWHIGDGIFKVVDLPAEALVLAEARGPGE